MVHMIGTHNIHVTYTESKHGLTWNVSPQVLHDEYEHVHY